MVRGSIILRFFFDNIKEIIESFNEEDATSIKFAQECCKINRLCQISFDFERSASIEHYHSL